MRTILLHLLLLAIPILGMSQSTPTSVNRGAANLTQVDQYLTAAKRLGIPTSPTDNLAATETPQNSAKLLYNTTLNKLRVYNPVTETWRDAIEADLTNYYTKTEIDALLNGKISTSEKGQNNGVAPLDASGKIPPQYVDIPDVPVTSVNGKTGDVVLTKADVGLGNVDNTSDLAKPISTATQTALDGKANTSHTHNASDINAGTLNIARIPTGTTGSTVALGNHTHTFAQITNKPTTLAGYGITDAYTKSEVNGLIPAPQTLSLVDEADVSISGGNTIALHSLRSRGIGWDTAFNGKSYFNTSSQGNPLGGSSVAHGIVIAHGGNTTYGTSLAFRNNRAWFQSLENGFLNPWVEIATREWANSQGWLKTSDLSGQYLKLGANTDATGVSNGMDLGSISSHGVYATIVSSSGLQNNPLASLPGAIYSLRYASGNQNIGSQMLFDRLGNQFMFRSFSSSTDSIGGVWRNVWHDGNLRSNAQNDARYLQLTGGTVTGVIKSPAPVADEDLANKAYVDSKASPFNIIDVTQQSYTDKAINVIAFDNQNNGVTYQEGSIDFGITRGAPHTMGVYAFKQGLNTTASGMASSAFGFQTVATGNYSSAFGRQTTASNAYSSAFGSETIASGQYSSAFGDRSTASGFSSSAFGGRSTASGQYSSAFGSQTIASGHYSTAFGSQSTANEFASLAIGRHPTDGVAQVGWVNGSPIFKVGNGTSPSNRRNAYVLYNDGRSEQIKDMEVTEIGQGFVLKSPDGTRWRITVDNSGNLTTTSL